MHFSCYVMHRSDRNPQETVSNLIEPYRETDNSGHWDWFQIGGRWTGALDGYDPEKDPSNHKPCDLCNGTGKRQNPPNIGAGNYPCNGCESTGTMFVWPTSFKPHEGDTQPISIVYAGMKFKTQKGSVIYLPCAFVDLQGEWHESPRKETVRNKRNWKDKVLAAFEKVTERPVFVTVVDCHT